jgi:Tfp pilus assembly protein PilV
VLAKRRQEVGSSLIEALLATLILTTGVVVMAQVLSGATTTNLAARRGTVATILAQQKLEELRALAWGELQPAPPETLEQNTDGYVDHVGIDGRIVGNSTQPPSDAVYSRRWSIERTSSGPDGALVLQVLVVESSSSHAARGGAGRSPAARMVTAKARKSP